jgi:hypothetical protein
VLNIAATGPATQRVSSHPVFRSKALNAKLRRSGILLPEPAAGASKPACVHAAGPQLKNIRRSTLLRPASGPGVSSQRCSRSMPSNKDMGLSTFMRLDMGLAVSASVFRHRALSAKKYEDAQHCCDRTRGRRVSSPATVFHAVGPQCKMRRSNIHVPGPRPGASISLDITQRTLQLKNMISSSTLLATAARWHTCQPDPFNAKSMRRSSIHSTCLNHVAWLSSQLVFHTLALQRKKMRRSNIHAPDPWRSALSSRDGFTSDRVPTSFQGLSGFCVGRSRFP